MGRTYKSKLDLVRAFPSHMQKDVDRVLRAMPDSNLSYSDCDELKMSGQTILVPHRIYYDEPDDSLVLPLTVLQQAILNTLYTRHHDGYVRERNVRRIIAYAAKEIWVTPYLMLLIGEYVEEILQVISENRSLLDADFIRTFIGENPKFYRTIQSRVVSYWDCYYRGKYPKKEQYVGFQVLQYLNVLLG